MIEDLTKNDSEEFVKGIVYMYRNWCKFEGVWNDDQCGYKDGYIYQ